jgi:glycosyltransferase involved in cell wall biosynthesis
VESNAVIVIPALNPPSSFAAYVEALKKEGFSRIVVVNDGSRTDKLPVFMKLKRLGAVVIDHEQNQGQGAAMRTGFRYYLDNYQGQSDGVITLNADRQISASDVAKIASSLHNEQAMGSFALVVGTRNLEGKNVSDYDYNMGGVMKLLYHMLMGVRLNDPLSGVFGIPDLRVRQCMDIESDGYAYVTSLTMSFEKIGFLQVPIGYAVYEDGAEPTFRKIPDTVRILFTIFKKFILYSITSVGASILDVIMFGIFTSVTFKGNPLAIIYGTICARVISASANYILTKRFVFHFKSDSAQTTTKSAGAFFLLTAMQCICSALVVSAVKFLLGGSAIGIKVLVDTALFFVSYKIQHKYIFKDDKKKEDPADGEKVKEAANSSVMLVDAEPEQEL